MKKYLFVTLLALTPGLAMAGELVKDAEITMIGNISGANGNNDFFIRVKGGVGPCAGAPGADQNIIFPVSVPASSGDADAVARAYSLALAAFTTGTKVRVYNMVDNTCNKASYIHTSK